MKTIDRRLRSLEAKTAQPLRPPTFFIRLIDANKAEAGSPVSIDEASIAGYEAGSSAYGPAQVVMRLPGETLAELEARCAERVGIVWRPLFVEDGAADLFRSP